MVDNIQETSVKTFCEKWGEKGGLNKGGGKNRQNLSQGVPFGTAKPRSRVPAGGRKRGEHDTPISVRERTSAGRQKMGKDSEADLLGF